MVLKYLDILSIGLSRKADQVRAEYLERSFSQYGLVRAEYLEGRFSQYGLPTL